MRSEDLGLIWEQCVLNEMQGQLQMRSIHYWRNKRGNEIDFVLRNKSNSSPIAIECKFIISPEDLALDSLSKNFESFRHFYPEGQNFIVASNIEAPFKRQHDGLTFSFVSPKDLIRQIQL